MLVPDCVFIVPGAPGISENGRVIRRAGRDVTDRCRGGGERRETRKRVRVRRIGIVTRDRGHWKRTSTPTVFLG